MRRLGWFIALYGAGILVIGAIALAIRSVLVG